MTEDDDSPATDDEWRLGSAPPADTTPGGGGLLQTILEEVTFVRDAAQADRRALADALNASFTKIELEIEVLRDQVTSLRANLDSTSNAVASAFAQLFRAVGDDTALDVREVIERVVAAQGEANVEAVVAALAPQLSALRRAVPTADTARIAVEVSRLRQSLIGPDHRS